MQNKSGVYQIVNLINKKRYVGSSVNLATRKSEHFTKLKKNKHHNIYLQRSYKKYGKDNFEFQVLEYVEDKDKLTEREQYYIDTLKPEYNIRQIAESNLGLKMSKETRKIMSEKGKQRKGKNNGMYGKKHSEETKEKMSKSQRGKKRSVPRSEEHRKHLSESQKGKHIGEKSGLSKLKENEVIEIKLLLQQGTNGTEIARKYNVQKSTISAIKTGRNWEHVVLEGDRTA